MAIHIFFGMHPHIGSMIKHIPSDSRNKIVVGIETLGAQRKVCSLCFLLGHRSDCRPVVSGDPDFFGVISEDSLENSIQTKRLLSCLTDKLTYHLEKF